MISQNMFCSEVEHGKFLSSIDIIPYAFDAIREATEKNLDYELHTSPYGIKVLAFKYRTDYTTRFVNGEFDLVSSDNHKDVVDFISTKVKPSFFINKAAVELFELLMNDLKKLEKEDIKSPLVVTGWGLGGYLAILYTLWLQSTMFEEETKRPICITFGSPLIGDESLRLAISERPQWEACFLNVVSMRDYAAAFVPSKDKYKPFGSFLFCTEIGGQATFKDHEAILAVLDALVSVPAVQKHDYQSDLSLMRRKMVLRRGSSESGEHNLQPLIEGIRLQFKEIGVLDKISNDLIKKMKLKQERMISKKKHTYDPTKKLNDIKLSMTLMEWYIKSRQSRGGYYDCYKREPKREEKEGHQQIIEQHVNLNIYWEKFVRERDQNPQKEGGKLRKRWLYSGNNYRRMIEPLDIAKHYKDVDDEKPKKKYIDIRPDHYKLLESWAKEDQKAVNSSAARNKAPNLNEDSCFWAHVEEALISLNALKINGSSSVHDDIELFMGYVMSGIKDRSVSPDIFLDGSSLMKWWSEYDTYKQGSCTSEFAQYMQNGRYKLYE